MLPEPTRNAVAGELSAMILVYNEAANIKRTLERLRWVPRVLVLDSFSTDETLAIAREYSNVDILQRAFDSFAGQCNWGLSQIHSEWVLSLDADYWLTSELIEQIQSLAVDHTISGYSARFRYCIYGVPLRKTILPPRTILYRRTLANYEDEGHGHRVRIGGATRQLVGYILHDDRKPLRRWLQSQIGYAELEAKHLLSSPGSASAVPDRLRKMIVPAPFLVLGYTLVGQMLILDGWRGWFYVMQRFFAEVLLLLQLLDYKLDSNRHGSGKLGCKKSNRESQ
jgi:glycosyltransferase involved in cell wall biosynthesis